MRKYGREKPEHKEIDHLQGVGNGCKKDRRMGVRRIYPNTYTILYSLTSEIMLILHTLRTKMNTINDIRENSKVEYKECK